MPKRVIRYEREWPKHVLDAFRSRSVRRAGLCVVGLLRGQGGSGSPNDLSSSRWCGLDLELSQLPHHNPITSQR